MSSKVVAPTGIQLFVFEKDRWKVFEADDPDPDPDHDPDLTATVAITDGDRHEIRIYGKVGLRRAIDIRSIKKCVVRGSAWIEMTDHSNRQLAIRCRGGGERDQNFTDFRERFITLVRLLKVKYEHTNSESRYPIATADVDKSGDAKASEIESRFTIKTKGRAKPPPLPPPLSPEPEDDVVPGVYDYVVGRATGIDWKKAEEQDYLVPIEHRRDLDTVRSPQKRDSKLDRTKSLPDSWSCYSCTLVNSLSDTHCDVCGAQRPPIGSPAAESRPATKPRRNRVDQGGCPNCQTPVVACPECQVERWRCGTCTIVNPAEAFECTGCRRNREDAWQCHVCRDVVGLKVTWCRRCDVWRCQLCHVQNDARENDSRRCRTCGQISI